MTSSVAPIGKCVNSGLSNHHPKSGEDRPFGADPDENGARDGKRRDDAERPVPEEDPSLPPETLFEAALLGNRQVNAAPSPGEVARRFAPEPLAAESLASASLPPDSPLPLADKSV